MQRPRVQAVSTFASVVFLVASFVHLNGCGKDKDAEEYYVRSGRVASIDLDTGAVTMWLYSAKKQKEVERSGTLAPNAEILINGRTARLEDVHVDDRIEVTGRIEKTDGEKNLIATRVEVTRPESATTQPSTQPSHAGANPDTQP
jgi:hypothetical protein